jgi:hypothetical protein
MDGNAGALVIVCSHCGSEYTAGVNAACRDCRLAPSASAAPSLPTSEEGPDELLFDLDSWPAEDRVALGVALNERGVPWRWEPGPVLVVREFDEAIVEEMLDAAEGGDEWEDLDGEDADEAAQEAMSDLFLAADRLVRSPGSGPLVEEVARLEEVVADSAPPFGVDPSVWDEMGDLAAGLVAAGDEADEEAVEQAAAALREFLRPYV